MCKDITRSINENDLEDVLNSGGMFFHTTSNFYGHSISNGEIPGYAAFKAYEINIRNNSFIPKDDERHSYIFIENHIEFKQTFSGNTFAKYNGTSSMIYCVANNTGCIGVNTVAVDLNKYGRDGNKYPFFISSGALSGCTVLCLHIQTQAANTVLFLHAGNSENKSAERPGNYQGTLCTGLYNAVFALFDLDPPAADTSGILPLVEALYDNVNGIQTGILVYNNKTGEKPVNGIISTISYNTNSHHGGAGYCLITKDGVSMDGAEYAGDVRINYDPTGSDCCCGCCIIS